MYNLAEITINYKPSNTFLTSKKVSCSNETHELLLDGWENLHHKESLKIILLNRANHVLGISVISEGGISGTMADPKIVFQVALKANASFVILAHNHPSGNIKPSCEDIEMTKKMVQAGKFLDLLVIDHLILAEKFYYSFADEGLL